MYAEPEQRAAEIDRGSSLPEDRLRRLIQESADALGADLDALVAEMWRHKAVTAQGRTVPVTEIPWIRACEVAVHAVDLTADVGFADLPDEPADGTNRRGTRAGLWL